MTPSFQSQCEELKRLGERSDQKHLTFYEKSFGYQLINKDGYAVFTFRPRVWNDAVLGQHQYPWQKEALALGKFIAAANPAVVIELLRRLELAIDTLNRYSWQYKEVMASLGAPMKER